MKKYYFLLFIIFSFFISSITIVNAQRGCCSRHGGVCGCSKYGKTICCDNTASPTCTCTPPRVDGCTDSKADNYNPNANHDNESCHYTIKGCMDPNASNYNKDANTSDGSCRYDVLGCTDKNATNYNPSATKNDYSCIYEKVTISTDESKEDIINDESDDGINVVNVLATLLLGGYGIRKLEKRESKKKYL